MSSIDSKAPELRLHPELKVKSKNQRNGSGKKLLQTSQICRMCNAHIPTLSKMLAIAIKGAAITKLVLGYIGIVDQFFGFQLHKRSRRANHIMCYACCRPYVTDAYRTELFFGDGNYVTRKCPCDNCKKPIYVFNLNDIHTIYDI
jgi:hypothetical protein